VNPDCVLGVVGKLSTRRGEPRLGGVNPDCVLGVVGKLLTRRGAWAFGSMTFVSTFNLYIHLLSSIGKG